MTPAPQSALIMLAIWLSLASGIYIQSSGANAKVPDVHVLQAWLAEECPMALTPIVGSQERAALLTTLLGLGVDYVVDSISSALTEAATADRDGVAKSGVTPTYLYRFEKKGSPPRMARCLVVALAPNGPRDWCEAVPFKNARACETETNTNGENHTRFARLLSPVNGTHAPTGVGEIALYLEVSLVPSNDQSAYVPRATTLYYLQSVSGESRKFGGTKPRNLTITASATTPDGKPALSTIHLHFRELVPSNRLLFRDGDAPNSVLDKVFPPSWGAAVKPPAYDAAPGSADHRLFPVNLAIELREIGDPNIFLQALAKAMSANKGKVASEAKARLPENAEAANTTAVVSKLEGMAKYRALVANTYRLEGDLRLTCGKVNAAAPDDSRAGVLQQVNALGNAQLLVRAEEERSNIAPSASFEIDVTKFADVQRTALEICKSLLKS
jgi:hypothetical protein